MNQETTEIRDGEEIDRASLEVYLNPRGLEGEIAIEQFPAGSSNLTYLLEIGGEEYVLRRPPFGNTVKSAHDVRREFDVLSKLSRVYSPAPKPLLFCADDAVIGSEFYLMERRRGLVIRGAFPTGGRLTQRESLDVCRAFINNLAQLHSLDRHAAGLGDLGHPDGYNRRQVTGWTKRYRAAKTDELPELEGTIAWLDENVPAEFGAALIHNDYKFDNIMLDPDDLTRVVAILDWEMVTVGDPLMDLGTTLGYWLSPDAGDEMLSMPFNPRILMENVSRADLVKIYSESMNRELPNMLFYYVFGTFKIAVIVQQIYARWVRGDTRDERFASYGFLVERLATVADRAISRGEV
ncbi:MAG: phosphotransferase family protein [Acidobacteriales bacterium]|nr:phosphotransferase family protein [Terriglobales bacterium]